MSVLTDDDMVQHFDLDELSRPNQIARDFDVSFGWRRRDAELGVARRRGGWLARSEQRACRCDSTTNAADV